MLLRFALLRLLVLLMVPAVILSTSTAARAASTSGVTWNFSGSSDFGFGPYECGASVTFDGGFIDMEGLYCYGGTDISPGFGQPAEEGTPFTVWVTGTNCQGYGSGEWLRGARDGLTLVHGEYPVMVFQVGSACDPALACIRLEGAGSVAESCEPVALDSEEPEPEECQINGNTVTMNRPTVGAPYPDPNWPGSTQGWTYQDVFFSGSSTSPGWFRYTVMNGPNGHDYWISTNEVPISGGTLFINGADQGVGQYATSATSTLTVQHGSRTDIAPGDQETWQVVGVGIVYAPLLAEWLSSGAWDTNSVHDPINRLPQDAPPPGVVGLSDPSLCSFYWGVKVAETPNEYDEPLGELPSTPGGGTVDPGDPVPDPPADGGAGCAGFDIKDPATWGEAGICAMVVVLGQLVAEVGKLVAAVLGLAAEIIGALLDLFTDLFKPNPGSWDFGPALDHMENRAPFSVVGDIADGGNALASSYQSAGSCGGLIANFDTGDPWSGDAQLTCAGLAGNPAYGALYSLVSAGLIAATGFALFRLFAGYFQDTAS